jgi:aminoglycoside phosphotransferase (APT) family kinase protein
LPTSDLVHGDLNLGNVLARGGAITGVVDWDAIGLGSRAVDLTGLLCDWQRLRLAGEPELAPTAASGSCGGSSSSPARRVSAAP